jgi:pyridoxal phosphate enzyme (YggS family)
MTGSDQTIPVAGAAELLQVRRRISDAARTSGRPESDITLIAVSKTFGPEHIKPILEAGQEVFGENRVQEAKAKWPVLTASYPQTKLHLIGPLQSNKAAEAVSLFEVIHTVDRPKLATVLAAEMKKQNRTLELFIQVNTGEEPQKAGVAPNEADGFIRFCKGELALPVTGLMCLPPMDEEPAMHFALLAKIARRNDLLKLSMGMSADLEKAIEFGATHVRVGSAIFGERTKPEN